MMNKKLLTITLFTVVVLWSMTLSAYATMVRKLNDEAMVNQAGTIVTGTVTSVKSEWNEDRTKIFTYITITPNNFLKANDMPQQIIIKQPGGEVGEIGMLVEGISVYEQGDEVLLFLKKGRKGFYRTIGLSQGTFSIQTDPVTQRRILFKKKAKITRTSSGTTTKKIFAVKSEKQLYLDDLETKIRDILHRRNDQSGN